MYWRVKRAAQTKFHSKSYPSAKEETECALVNGMDSQKQSAIGDWQTKTSCKKESCNLFPQMSILRPTVVKPHYESKSHWGLTMATWIAVLAAAWERNNVCINPVRSCLVVRKLGDVHYCHDRCETRDIVKCTYSLGWDQKEIQDGGSLNQ